MRSWRMPWTHGSESSSGCSCRRRAGGTAQNSGQSSWRAVLLYNDDMDMLMRAFDAGAQQGVELLHLDTGLGHVPAVAIAGRTPMGMPLANGSNVVWDGPCRLTAIVIGGGAGTATTITVRDTTGGHPTGGVALQGLTVPANGAPLRVDYNRDLQHGLVINLSQELDAYALIEGIPGAVQLGPSDGALLFQFDANATSVTRVTTHAQNTNPAYIKQGSTSYRVVGNTNPAGDIVAGWASGSVASLIPITPGDLFQCLVLDVYVVAPGQRYANATYGDGLGCRLAVWIDDGAGNQFNSEYLDVCQGWNRLVFPRAGFTVGAGAPSWATTTFTTYSFRFAAGTTGTPELYFDRLAMNCGSASPFQFMLDLDDGFDPDDLFTQQMLAYPNIRANQFLVVDFSETSGNPVYASFATWRALQQKLGRDRLYLGWHSKTHTGPTAMELFPADRMAEEVTAWLAAARAAGIDTSNLHGVTPNGQDSAIMRSTFGAYGFKSNRTVRPGVCHPAHLRYQPYDMRQLYLSDTTSYGNFAANIQRLQQTRCMGVFLTHAWSLENAGGAPVSTAATSLNLKKTETDDVLGQLSAMVRAGLAVNLTRDTYMAALGL